MDTTRIRWSDHPGSIYGYAGTCDDHLFIIWKPVYTEQDEGVLVTTLPGLGEKRWHSESEDEMKQAAEEWLTEFAASIGATLAEPVTTKESSQ